ncbi:hypothetical protein [Treponema sp.]|uniref:hypothetical protein n=1 Tax=Treponema sp. TaxID=166 RepID=UPI00298E37A6|nr:hypothetical protein [Treponema sp.]MCR5612851.1 hypothetical protein [Treponema sp.]
MKKYIISAAISAMCALSVFAGEFKPELHINPSVRQQGFGGFYTTDVDNFYGIYANPAALGRKRKHALFPSIDAHIAGPLADMLDIKDAIMNQDMAKLGTIIDKNNGLKLGVDVAPLLCFGKISSWGFGWAFNTDVFVKATIPSVTLSDISAGAESVLTMGFGFPIIRTDNHMLSVGATAKGFAQIATAYNGNALEFINKISKDYKSLPAYLTAGFSFDVGAMYTLCNAIDVSVVWYDAFSMAFISQSTFGELKFNFNKNVMLDSRLAAGVAYHLPVAWTNGFISSFKIMADYRNFFVLFKPGMRNPILELSCGTELVLGNILSLRFGMQEMYPAVGVGLSFGVFKLDFSMYGRELGLEPGSAPCLNASLFLGFTY